jgi:hypothetical protein
MKTKKKSNLTKRVTIRFSPDEYDKIYKSYTRTTKRRLSDYFRFIMLDKPITVYTRNQSLDNFLTELVLLKNELRAVGNNLNQVVKKLNSMESFPEVRMWQLNHEKRIRDYMEKVNEINSRISQISEQWLPE